MKIGLVMLVLTFWNCDNGIKLEERTEYFYKTSAYDDVIRRCRLWGVGIARVRVAELRRSGIGNASANVNCAWVREGAAT